MSRRMANSTKCLTSGAQFHTSIGPTSISISVDLPFFLNIDSEEAEIIEILMHNSLEQILRPYFLKEEISDL